MNTGKRIDYKTRIRVWLLTITLSIAILAVISPAGAFSFRPGGNKTEVSWRVSSGRRCTVVVYGDKICSAVRAKNGSAVFPPAISMLYTTNELIKIKFQHQRKLNASLKTSLQLSSIGGNPRNSEQEPLFG